MAENERLTVVIATVESLLPLSLHGWLMPVGLAMQPRIVSIYYTAKPSSDFPPLISLTLLWTFLARHPQTDPPPTSLQVTEMDIYSFAIFSTLVCAKPFKF